MQERVVEMIPRLVYASSPDGLGEGMEDAMDVALGGVLERIRRRRGSIAREGQSGSHRFSLPCFLPDMRAGIWIIVISLSNMHGVVAPIP
jgi:hypothetical protein